MGAERAAQRVLSGRRQQLTGRTLRLRDREFKRQRKTVIGSFSSRGQLSGGTGRAQYQASPRRFHEPDTWFRFGPLARCVDRRTRHDFHENSNSGRKTG